MKNIFIVVLLVLLSASLLWLWSTRDTGPAVPSDDTDDGGITDDSVDDGEGTFVGIPDLIQIEEPKPGQRVDEPISVSGQARGFWFFEATAPVTVTNWDGLILGEGYITATGDWMTEESVPFTGTISFTPEIESYSATGTLIFRKDNPSGLPKNDQAFEMNVLLPTAP